MTQALQIKTPRWSEPLFREKRYKGAKGGRSSGKSHFMAEYIIEKHMMLPGCRSVCIREVQKSLKYSAKRLLEDKIKALGVDGFDAQSTEIRTPGDGVIIFQGMQDHTAESVKSLEGFDTAWCEEAQSLSKRSLELLDPTMRKDGCELLFSWNPQFDDDPVEDLFRENDEAVLVHVNYDANPFCPQSMKDLAERERRRDFDNFSHIWLGEYVNMSERQVFKNYRTGEIDPPENAVWFYGADWGFAVDPTAAVRCCIPSDGTLYIDAEVYETGTPTESLPTLLSGLPDAAKWPMRGDSSRPETIDYLRRHGFPKLRKATKGKGSIEDGIEFLRGMDIVIHPRCSNTLREFKRYSYKVDPKTEEILPVIEDAHNHAIDALRYAVEGLHRRGKMLREAEVVKNDRLRRPPDYRSRPPSTDNWKVA